MLVPKSVRKSLLVVIALLCSALVVALGNSPAGASHYRATQITWQQTTGNTVEFHLSASWRCTFFFSDCAAEATPGAVFSSDPLEFGDGSSSDGNWEVVSSDPTNDVVTAEAHATHTYASPGPFTAFLESCCRLSPPSHINNPDGGVREETIVDLTKTSANAESSMPPIVDCALNAVCKFFVPAFDPDGQGLAWRLSTADEASGTGGGFIQPAGASINAATGAYTWDTTGATLNPDGDSFYSTQVMVENVVNGAVITKTPVDFFIRLTSSPNQQPVFVSPTPADGAVINGTTGAPVTFSVKATDPDSGDTVTPGIVNKPSGATFATTPGNPATGTFTWTPTTTGTTIVNLTAQDGSGLGAQTRSVTIVIAQGSNTPTTTQLSSSSNPSTYGTPVTFTAKVSPTPPGGSVQFTVDGNSLGAPVALNASGTAVSASVSSLVVGNHPVGAKFLGSGAYTASQASLTQVVGKAATKLTLSSNLVITQTGTGSSQNPQLLNPLGRLTTTAGLPIAGQTVTFKSKAVTLCSGVTNANGVATCGTILSNLPVLITLGYDGSFAGDANYLPSSGHAPVLTLIGLRIY